MSAWPPMINPEWLARLAAAADEVLAAMRAAGWAPVKPRYRSLHADHCRLRRWY